MNDKDKDKTTRWEDVKGKARHLYDKVGLLDFEDGGPYPPGAEFAMALCAELDRMQEELTYVHNLVAELREKVWRPVEVPLAGKELSDDMIYDMQEELKAEIESLRLEVKNLRAAVARMWVRRIDRMQEEIDKLKGKIKVLVAHDLKRSRLEEETPKE